MNSGVRVWYFLFSAFFCFFLLFSKRDLTRPLPLFNISIVLPCSSLALSLSLYICVYIFYFLFFPCPFSHVDLRHSRTRSASWQPRRPLHHARVRDGPIRASSDPVDSWERTAFARRRESGGATGVALSETLTHRPLLLPCCWRRLLRLLWFRCGGGAL